MAGDSAEGKEQRAKIEKGDIAAKKSTAKASTSGAKAKAKDSAEGKAQKAKAEKKSVAKASASGAKAKKPSDVSAKRQKSDKEPSRVAKTEDGPKPRSKAKLSYVRMSSRKVKIVIDLIRGKAYDRAIAILKHTPKAASAHLIKLLSSAAANAENNHQMDVDRLYVKEIYADQGPTLKRHRPRAKGRAFPILKRTCHITVVLEERAL